MNKTEKALRDLLEHIESNDYRDPWGNRLKLDNTYLEGQKMVSLQDHLHKPSVIAAHVVAGAHKSSWAS